MDKSWNITKNKEVLKDYDNLSIKKLPEEILSKGLIKTCANRTNSKALYICVDKENESFYEVFINFIVPVPLNFWPISLYAYKEKYPELDDFGYRAWIYLDIHDAIKKYESLD